MVYSDKFLLNVVDLKHIELATEVDKEFQLDAWAKFFTATTWEEVIMVSENNPYIAEAAQTLYEANADRLTEMKCRARRDFYKQKNTTEKIMRELTEENEKLHDALESKDNALAEKDNALAEKDAYIKELEAKLTKQNS